MSDAELEAAAVECLQECTFWPTVAEVRSRCNPTRRGMTIPEAEAAILREHPGWADPAVQRARMYAFERRTRAWRKAQAPRPRPMLEEGA